MRNVFISLLVFVMGLSILQACSPSLEDDAVLPGESSYEIAVYKTHVVQATQEALLTPTRLEDGKSPDKEFASDSEVVLPTLTPTGTPIPTVTPVSQPLASVSDPGTPSVVVSVNTNCRSGPGKDYDYLGSLLIGERAEILAVPERGDGFIVIDNPRGEGHCWLWLGHATISGNLDALPRMKVPPKPTPIFACAGATCNVLFNP